MGLGGPVWHASVKAHVPMPSARVYKLALKVLRGVGDPAAGEWMEMSWPFVHVRRRLTVAEAAQVGPVVDIRRTGEARRRADVLGARLAHAPVEVLADEVG